jgi:hypothetical protein
VNAVEMIPRAERIAKEIAREWPGIEADDIQQEILLHVLEPENNFESNEYDEQTLTAVLRTIGTRYANGERYAYTFNSAQYVYTPAEVRALLEEAFFDPACWEDAPRKEVDHRLNVAGGGVSVALMDLREAFYKLGPSIQDTIRKRYATAEELSATERMRITRGVEAMTRSLNRFVADRGSDHDGPGSRSAMSNAKAQAVTKNHY